MRNPRTATKDDILSAIRELKMERQLANCDFYPDRREALDIAIFFLKARVEEMTEREVISGDE